MMFNHFLHSHFYHIHFTNPLVAVVAVLAGVIAVLIALKFMGWLLAELWVLAQQLVNASSQLLIRATTAISWSIKRAAIALFKTVWSLLFTALLFLAQPIKLRGVKVSQAIKAHAKLRQLYWKYGHEEFADFASFKRRMLGEEEPEAEQQKPGPQKGSYEEALAVMGFSGADPVSLAALKSRHREMISVVHPDKGFQNAVFAQQLNGAMDIIKSARKWK